MDSFSQVYLMFFLLSLGALYALAPTVSGAASTAVQHTMLGNSHTFDGTTTRMSQTALVGVCLNAWELTLTMQWWGPGYTLGSFQECDTGLTAQLALSGLACNTFGLDISDLTIEVMYQLQSMYIVSRTCLMQH
ncbi:hypothetical protein BD769DRAFT_1383326 [Suillus cothurnatus]|nr:hypothetical protein BD769DRAFT_1383326 [Suillus cothurnatus]